ncbi:MAG: hypothetical protein KDC44_10215, partial [Phaeodactylibacter sp.]|nr:hypothetical protein [Phaeodactylibacter sp.]
MKRLLLSFFFSLAMLYLPAQNTKTYQFENGIGGIEFTGFNILGAVPKGEGTRIFLELSRVGAIQAKTGPVMSGGNDPVTIKALGVIDLAADQGVEQELVRWIKPDGTPKQFNILEAPGKILGKPLATQDDCVTISALVAEYPDIRQLYEEGAGSTIEPYSYYNNYINYTMLGAKPKNIALNYITVDAEGKKDYQEKEIDIEDYRGNSKDNYWLSMESNACDAVSGNFWAYHGRMIRKEYSNRSNMYLMEMVVFDKDGKELNRTELTFEKPQLLLRSQYFYGLEDDQTRILGKAHIYGEAFGFGYKKLNPEPNEKLKHYYEWDANGNLVQQVDFEAPSEDFKPLYLSKGTEKTVLLAQAGKDTYRMEFVNGALAASEKLGA